MKFVISLAMFSFCLATEAGAGQYYLRDGRNASLSGPALVAASKDPATLDHHKNTACYSAFLLIKPAPDGNVESTSYLIDYDALSKGVIRYIRTVTDKCEFDKTLQVDQCHDQGAASGSKVYRGRILSSKALGEDVFLYKPLTDAEWTQLGSGGTLSLPTSGTSIGGVYFNAEMVLQFNCSDDGADLSKYLDDKPSDIDLKKNIATYKERRGANGLGAPLNDAEWSSLTKLLGLQ